MNGVASMLAVALCGLGIRPLSPVRRLQLARSADVRLQLTNDALAETLDILRTTDTIITRTLDTLEDAYLLARRVKANPVDTIDCLEAWQSDDDPRPRLLIIGSGWAAHALVKIVDADLFRLLVVSPRNFFVFTPMLAASSVGTVEYRSITEPMRAANPRAAFIEGSVTDIDPFSMTAQVLIGDGGDDVRQLAYDTAVVACGVRASVSAVPGVAEHCCFLKELQARPHRPRLSCLRRDCTPLQPRTPPAPAASLHPKAAACTRRWPACVASRTRSGCGARSAAPSSKPASPPFPKTSGGASCASWWLAAARRESSTVGSSPTFSSTPSVASTRR